MPIMSMGPTIDGDAELTRKVNAIVKRQSTAPVRSTRPGLPRGLTKKNDPSVKKSTKTTKRSGSQRRTSSRSTRVTRSSRSSSGGGGGGGGPTKSSDKPQVDALLALLNGGFQSALNQQIANAAKVYEAQDRDLVRGYESRFEILRRGEADNEQAEADATFGNLANRAREASELLSQSTALGAGETDNLRAQLLALRNADDNQQEINRSYWDTQKGLASAAADLTNGTRTARSNLAADYSEQVQRLNQQYYNQRQEAWAQIGNISANPLSDQYNKHKDAFNKMVADAKTVASAPEIPANIRNWYGSHLVRPGNLNNSDPRSLQQREATKRPEGSTLRSWGP